MSSWLILHSLGSYPNAGQDIYLIGTPSFPEVEIALGSGRTPRILARNMGSEHTSRFIQSATPPPSMSDMVSPLCIAAQQ